MNHHNLKKNKSRIFYAILAIAIIVLIVLIVRNKPSPTGRVSFEITTTYIEGEPLAGDLKFRIKEGECVPKDSVVIANYDGATKNFSLSELVSDTATSGEYYAEDSVISGEGEGYCVLGTKVIEPEINFKMRVYRQTGGSSETSQSSEVENNFSEENNQEQNNSASEISETSGDSSGEVQQVDGNGEEQTSSEQTNSEETSVSETVSSQNSESSESSSSSSEQASDSGESASVSEISGDAGITGGAITEDEFVVEGSVSRGKNFVYNLEPDQRAEIVEGSVNIENELIPDGTVSLQISDGKATVSTEYFVNEQGYGEDFLGSFAKTLYVDITQLGFTATSPGPLHIELDYNGQEISSQTENVEVSSKSINESVQNKTIFLKKEIPTIRINENESYTLDLNEYFSGATSFEITDIDRIKINYENKMVVFSPEEGFRGARRAKITAYNADKTESLESNEFLILVSSGKVKITTTKEKVVVGEKVKVTKTIEGLGEEGISVEVPKVENVNVKEVTPEGDVVSEENLDPTRIIGNVVSGNVVTEIELNKKNSKFLSKLFTKITESLKKMFSSFTGRVVDVNDFNSGDQNVNLLISETENQENKVVISYEIPGPEKKEEIKQESGQEVKEVVVSGDEQYGTYYQDIIADTQLDLSQKVAVGHEDRIKIYWITDETDLKEQKEPKKVPEQEIVEEESSGNETNSSYENESVSNESVSVISGNAISDEEVTVTNLKRVAVPFEAYDTDEDGYVDYIEWVVPHLSNQTYQIVIEISRAEHLDSNRVFVSDIYDSVKALDGNWSETVNAGEFVRVTFETNLTAERDITIYPRAVNGTPQIEVYEKNGSEIVARFDSLNDNQYNKVILNDLGESQDVFDLKIIGGEIQIDHIIDPSALGPNAVDLNAPTNWLTGVSTNPKLTVTPSDPDSSTLNVSFWNRGVSISSGNVHTCAILQNETAVCWGSATNGALGDGSSSGQQNNSVAVSSSERFVAISSGLQFTCGLTQNGSAYCWGAGGSGQLGYGGLSASSVPVAVNSSDRFVMISAGGSHTCAITTNGTAVCWGAGSLGRLGYGAAATQVNPIYVNSTNKFVVISAGTLHTCGIIQNGTAYCWGSGTSGRVGYGGTAITNSNPLAVNTSNTFIAISAGGTHSCGIIQNGSVMCWGSNSQGQVGDGLTVGTVGTYNNPIYVNTTINNFISISAGSQFTCGLTQEGNAYCWGIGGNGQLGDGLGISESSPALVSSSNSFISLGVQTAQQHMCGIIQNGSVMCWGLNSNGEVGNGNTTDQRVPAFVNSTNSFLNLSLFIANSNDAANGSQTSVSWSNLPTNRTRFWSASAKDDSRIYNSLIWAFTTTADTNAPSVSLNAPANGNSVLTASVSFNATFSDNSALANATFYLWNSSNSLINTTTSSLSGNSGSVNLSVTLPYTGTFMWNYLVFDSSGNSAFNSVNFSLTYAPDTTPPQVAISFPAAGAYYNSLPLNFNVSLNENGSVSYSLDSGAHNVTMSSIDNRNFNATNSSISDGNYTFRVFANDSVGNNNYTVNASFVVDRTVPLVAIVIPQNASYNAIQTALNYSVSDINLQSCWYSINLGATNTSITCGNNVSGLNSGQGSSTWKIYANDSAGNANLTASVTFYVDSVAPLVNFTSPTPNSGSSQNGNSIYVNLSSSDLNSHYAFVDLNRDLRIWMRMDDLNASNGTIDLSSWSNNGTKYNGAFPNSTGMFGSSFFFNGTTNSAIIVRNNESLTFDSGQNMTFSAWIKIPAFYSKGEKRYILAKTFSGSDWSGIYEKNNYYIYLKRDTADTETFVVVGATGYDGGGSSCSQIKYAAINGFWDLSSWHQIVVEFSMFDNTVAKHLWIDNNEITLNGEDSACSGTYNFTNTADLSLGAMSNRSLSFKGNIDEALIFSRSLSDQERGSLYGAGSNQYYRNFTSLVSGRYNFTGYSVDAFGNRNQTETRSVTVNTVPPSINFTFPTPASGTFSNSNILNINVSASDSTLANVTIRVYNSTYSLVGSSVFTSSPFNASFSASDGVYYFNASAVNSLNNVNNTETRNVSVDTTLPSVSYGVGTLDSGESVGTDSVYVNVSVVEANEANITFSLFNITNGLVNSTTFSAGVRTINWTSLDRGLYKYNVTVTDLVNYAGNTSTRLIYIDTYAPSANLIAPTNGSVVGLATQRFNATFSDNSALANATFYLWNSSNSLINTTTSSLSGTSGSINLSVTLPYTGTFMWNYLVTDGVNNHAFNDTNYTLTYSPNFLESCGTLSIANGIYNLTTDIVNYSGTCFTITADNITLDGRGHSISENATANSYYGIYSSGTRNVTIKNITISNFGNNIYLENSANSNIFNVNMSSSVEVSYGIYCTNCDSLNAFSLSLASGGGIYLGSSNNSVVSNITINASDNSALSLDSNSWSNIFRNISIVRGGVLITQSSYNNFSDVSVDRGTSGTLGDYYGFRLDGGANNNVFNRFTVNNTDSGIMLRESQNNSFTNGEVRNSASDAIYFSVKQSHLQNSYDGTTGTTFQNISFINTNSSKKDLLFGVASVNNTQLIDMPHIGNYGFNYSGGVIVRDSAFGEIIFLSSINGAGTNLTRDISIRNNSATVRSDLNSGLNVSANITLYGTPGAGFVVPAILRNGELCGNICSNLTALNAVSVIFNVSSWTNYSIGENITIPSINFTSPTPASGTFSNSNILNINVSASDSTLVNVTIRVYNSTYSLVGSSVFTSSPFNASFSVSDGIYYFNASAVNSLNNVNNTETRNVSVDTTKPLISYGVGTLNDGEISDAGAIYVNVSVVEANEANITFSLFNITNGLVNSSTFSAGVRTINWTSLADGTYRYNVSSIDLANNQNSSATRTITLVSSCLNICTENSQNCTINRSCVLHDGLCSGGICDFGNLVINSSVYTLYNSSGDGRNLDLNISNMTFLSGGWNFTFSGQNGSSIGSGSRGGNAGKINITVPGLFNTTNARFIGQGGYSTLSATAGGNGGILQLNYHGLIRNFTDLDYDEEDNRPSLTFGRSTNSLNGIGGRILYNKDDIIPRDSDITNDGAVDTSDKIAIETKYNNRTGDNTYEKAYDIDNDGKLDVYELAKVGFEWGTR